MMNGQRDSLFWCFVGGVMQLNRKEVRLYQFIRSMQNNYNGNLLRNSYGYQLTETQFVRNQAAKGFPMPQTHSSFHQQDNISSSLRQMQSKIEGFEGLMKRKQTTEEKPTFLNNIKSDQADPRPIKQSFNNQQQQPIGENLLRGSCQNILRKFDYSNLRNTTHFNPMNKVVSTQEGRRSPQPEHRHMHFNKTLTQEYAPSFLKGAEKGYMQESNSFLSPSKTPPKVAGKTRERTPIKYKTVGLETAKTSAMSKSPENEQKKVFKSLNEIVAMKQRQKQAIQISKGLKRSRMVNGFEFGRVLGKGKFGEVFLSRHHDTGFVAAIKKIEKRKVVQYKMVDQFTKEIRLHASLQHPNIVKFYGVFEEKEDIYLVMEYMNGGTLFDYLNEVPCLPVRVAVEYLKDIIEALNYMHDKSIAHRDIKPENIVISSEGVAKLCDFGWSAVVETSRKTYCGTFDYAPPEILERKNYDSSVDLWCIGVLTYELLTGRVPFEGDKRNEVMDKIVNVDKNKIEYPVDIPLQAREFIEALVQKDPAQRPRCQDLLKFSLFSSFSSKPGKPRKAQ